MPNRLLARKTDFSDSDDREGPALKRTLGPWGLTALCHARRIRRQPSLKSTC
ncbi:MAG: hypothetical protein LBQ20_00995 [Rhodanobacter sp.]|nr:hypothetical protein [Rhodanobacter sp.]